MLTKRDKYTMNIKDISKSIKGKLKTHFPKCKFSVTIERYSGGQSMTVALLSAPFDPFVDNAEINGCPVKDSHQVNHYYLAESDILSRDAKILFLHVHDMINYFNYDDSDSMTDYFDVNFYEHLAIGKWNKPFTQTH